MLKLGSMSSSHKLSQEPAHRSVKPTQEVLNWIQIDIRAKYKILYLAPNIIFSTLSAKEKMKQTQVIKRYNILILIAL